MKLNLLKYINYRVKVKMRDGRTMEGTMLSVDDDTNVVLDDAEEFGNRDMRRTMGLVVIRGDFVVEVEIISKPVSQL